ncbi:hypothetical protein HY384_00140 [Candidatus Daviesbacteria bacterium]|nr:hypothetical protein [Candidatus Daviesbacteria bacterium]
MTHLPFTLLAYFFNALSLLTNKFLLQKTIPDPLIFIFYISALSLLTLLALPFTNIPDLKTFIISSISTLLWTGGAYLMFKALKIGLVSRVIPIIGGLIPLFLLLATFQTNDVLTYQIWAILILVSGMAFLTLTDLKGHFNFTELVYEISSACFFALSYLYLKQAYLSLDFFSVLAWSRIILIPFVAMILIIPNLRRKIIPRAKINFFSFSGLIFLGGQISGTVSELLLLFSISLANPALVNSLAGTQYVFLFIFAAVLSKKYPQIFAEKYSVMIIITKFLGTLLVGLGLYLLAFSPLVG